MSDATHSSIDLSIQIDAPRERVWSVLTDAAEIPRWLAPSATVESGPGGFVELSWGEGMTGRNTIEVWQPPERLVVGNSDAGLQEDYTLTEAGTGTTLHLRHAGFPATPEGAAHQNSINNGWRAFFRMLQHGVSRHAGQPYRNITLFTQLKGPRDEAWNSICRPGGLTKQGLPSLKSGDTYEAELFSGMKLKGSVLHSVWPGYLVLTAANLEDSLLALLCEGGPGGAMLTITWILNGNALTREAEIRSSWSGWMTSR